MVPALRAAFNATFDAKRYDRYVRDLEARTGGEIGFRLAETPVFCDPALARACSQAAREIVAQLADPHRFARYRDAIERHHPPARGATGLPQFAVVDFAIARDGAGNLVPRLIELQGFPSLYAFEIMQGDAWRDALVDMLPDVALTPLFGALTRADALHRLRAAIVGDADPAEVVLLDRAPHEQKTACDFRATQTLFGVQACDPSELRVHHGRLRRRAPDGMDRPVTRIYNRLVGDDLERANLPFDLRDEAIVTWAPHPAWFWLWSKASLPALDHPCAPATRLLGDWHAGDDDVSRYVLKPLFAFAGSGVNVTPTEADVAAIATHERHGWCLQERITYAPALRTPDGKGVKTEIRVMLARADDAPELEPIINLARLSRGLMHGVDHNKNQTWVGSTIALWPSA